jgi:hypothetical protein
MNRTSLIITMLLLGVTGAEAETFKARPFLPERGVEVFSRSVANNQLGRDLFGDPYATVVVGNVDIYDRFPYVEARYFQIVSDPKWNRLLMGEAGQGLFSYDGRGGRFGSLSEPHGLATDGNRRVYVADTGNNRVVVFDAVSEFENIRLEPAYAIDGLHKPFGLAWSDGGTPNNASDDALYVANTGRNEVRRYALSLSGANLTAAIGELGSGDGRFAGPIAIAAGRYDGRHNGDVYVADAHNSRIVMLRDQNGTLAWAGESAHDLGTVTSLDTDHWGNLYAAAPHDGRVQKLTAALEPIAALSGDLKRPRSVHAVFATVTDHRDGSIRRAGQGSAVLVEAWGGQSGLRAVDLGVELRDANSAGSGTASVSVTLTDHAIVTAALVDRQGQVVARRGAETREAGRQTIRFDSDDFVAPWQSGDFTVEIQARSAYDNGGSGTVRVPVLLSGSGGPALPSRLTLLGNSPNPFNPSTSIRFVVPAGSPRPYSLRVYDVRGKLVRELGNGPIDAGTHAIRWDGRDDRGAPVASGVYLYRVSAGTEIVTGKMALLK